MTIYLLMKDYEFCGEYEDEEVTAYENYNEAQAIADAFEEYSKKIEELDEEYNRLNLRYHPELKGQLGKLKQENRAKYWAVKRQARAQNLDGWSHVYVVAKELQ